jgi:hypothetical protein
VILALAFDKVLMHDRISQKPKAKAKNSKNKPNQTHPTSITPTSSEEQYRWIIVKKLQTGKNYNYTKYLPHVIQII